MTSSRVYSRENHAELLSRLSHHLKSIERFQGIELRYGENPHQDGIFIPDDETHPALLGATIHQEGKGCSLVNILDMDAAFRTVSLFRDPAVCINKHASPCGVATARTVLEAYHDANACDPLSAFGGVIAANVCVTEEMAIEMTAKENNRFTECIIAPEYSTEALTRFASRKDLRVLELPLDRIPQLEFRSVIGGVLVQEVDRGDPPETKWTVVSKRQPMEEEWAAMKFAWPACQPILSNAIVLVQGTATAGIGGGQPNRVDCVRMAVARAGEKAKGSVMGSDSFFPFRDSIDVAHEGGVAAVVFQGGSKRDDEVIAAADEYGMALVKTGVRHFRH